MHQSLQRKANSSAYLPRWTGNGGAEFEKGRIKATMIGRYVAKIYTQDANTDVVNNVPGSFDPIFRG